MPGVPEMTARLALLGILVACASCADLRGRRRVREGNRLFREGLYAQALENYRAAETLVPRGFVIAVPNVRPGSFETPPPSPPPRSLAL